MSAAKTGVWAGWVGVLWALAAGVGCRAVELPADAPYRCVRGAASGEEGACPDAAHFCAVDLVCRARAEGGSYVCLGDEDCGGGWRCGPSAVCVDPSQDALRADVAEPTFAVTRVFSGELPWSQLGAVGPGGSFVASVKPGGGNFDATPLALAQGSDVFAVVLSDQGFGTLDGGLPQRLFVAKGSARAPVTDVAAVRRFVWATAGNELSRFDWGTALGTFDGGLGQLSGVHQVAVGTRLRVGQASWPLVAEFTDGARPYRLHDSQTGQSTPVQVASAPLGDVVDSGGKYLYAAMGGALFALDRAAVVADLNDGNGGFDAAWAPVSIASPGRSDFLTDCSGAPNLQYLVRGIHLGVNPDPAEVESPLVALEVQPASTGEGGRGTHWMRVDPDSSLGSCGGNVPKHVARGPCPVCGLSERLLDLQWGFGPSSSGVDEAQLVSSCVRPTGDRIAYALRTDALGYFCYRDRLREVPPPESALRQRSHPSVRATAEGRLVQLRTDGLSNAVSLSLDAPPSAVDVVAGSVMALHQGALYRDTPGMGLALYRRASPGGENQVPVGFVEGRPDWFILENGSVLDVDGEGVGLPSVVALPEREGLMAPFSGKVVSTAEGKSWLLLTAFDALLAADVSGAAQGKVATLSVRQVPLPQVALKSLAVLPTAPEGALLAGYLLTDNRLFSFRAASLQRWDLAEVRVRSGAWMSLWMDQDRGRVGYQDGSVDALPSGVQIAERLPSEAGTVAGFTHVCGRSFVLTATGLYRLDADADAVGRWTKVGLAGLPLPPGGWQRGFAGFDQSLFLFGQGGLGVQLRAPLCPEG